MKVHLHFKIQQSTDQHGKKKQPHNIFLWREKKIVFASERKVFRLWSHLFFSFRCNLWGKEMSFGIWHSNKDNLLILAQAKNSTEWQNTRHGTKRSHWDDDDDDGGKLGWTYGQLKPVLLRDCESFCKTILFYQIVSSTKVGGRKEFQMSSRKSAAAGQSGLRLFQPSIGMRLFMTQSSSAWGRAGGTSDHFHPSVRRHKGRHKQQKSQFLRKDFLGDRVGASSCTVLFSVPTGASCLLLDC